MRAAVRSAFACLFAIAGIRATLRAQTAAELVAQRYDVDPQHSTVAFTSTILGAVHVRGRFTAYDATIVCDPKHPDRSSVSAFISVASITTDMPFRDDHLKSPDFFDAKQFPTISFVSDEVTRAPGGAMVSGTLTMHGVSRPTRFFAKMLLEPHVPAGGLGRVAFSAELRLSRQEFGIAGTNKYNPSYNPLTNLLSDSVDVLLELEATRTSYATRTLGTGTPPGVADTVNRVLRARGVDAALETYRTLKSTRPNDFRFTAGQLDVLGHQAAERGALSDALKLLEYNAELYAETPGVLESLAEVQALSNDGSGALATYRRILGKSPENAVAREMARHLARVTNSGDAR